MPGMNGFQLCKKLRERRTQRPFLPIVFLTAASTFEERLKGLEAGGDDIVRKPFQPEELVGLVRPTCAAQFLELQHAKARAKRRRASPRWGSGSAPPPRSIPARNRRYRGCRRPLASNGARNRWTFLAPKLAGGCAGRERASGLARWRGSCSSSAAMVVEIALSMALAATPPAPEGTIERRAGC